MGYSARCFVNNSGTFKAELPRVNSALDSLLTLRDCGLSAIACAASKARSSDVDAGLASSLQSALREQVQCIINVLRTELDNPDLQGSGAQFVATAAAAGDSAEIRRLLFDCQAPVVLADAVRKHPHCKQVQDNAQWALFELVGREPILDLLRDSASRNVKEIVAAAMWALFQSEKGPAGELPWAKRLQIAQLVQQASSIHPKGGHIIHALGIVGWALDASAPDCDQREAAAAVSWVLRQLQEADDDDTKEAAANCLANLAEGNVSTVSLLLGQNGALSFGQNPAAAQLCSETLANALRGSPKRRGGPDAAARVVCSIFGVPGLLNALAADSLQDEWVQVSVLRAIDKYAQDADTQDLLRMDAVGRVSGFVQGSSAVAAAAIAALGRISEFLVAAASAATDNVSRLASEALTGVDVIVKRLEAEVQSETPNISVYAEALRALKNVSKRSDELAKRVGACTTLTLALETAFERDYFDLTSESLGHLLGAIHFFAGLPKLQTMLQKYPNGPIFHEAACRILIEAVLDEDGSKDAGTILGAAPNLAFYATTVLGTLVPQAPFNGEKFAAAAIELLGHVLGATGADVHLEAGLRAMFEAASSFYKSANVASEICRALVALTANSPDTVVPVVTSLGAGDFLLDVSRRFPNNPRVACDAAVALGALAGVARALDPFLDIDAFVGERDVTCAIRFKTGCRAVAEICRQGFPFTQAEAEMATKFVIEGQRVFHTQEHWELQSQAEVTLGLVRAAADPTCKPV